MQRDAITANMPNSRAIARATSPLATRSAAPSQGATISEGLSPAQYRQNEANAASLGVAKNTVANHDNYGRASTQNSFMVGAAYGAVDYATGAVAGKALSAISKILKGGVSKALTAEVRATASALNSSGKSPATIVGTELNGQTAIATSGAPPATIAPQLEEDSAELGGIGTRTASGNTVGCCGEFHAANELLLQNPAAKHSQVNFTDAIRPRTGEVVPSC